MGFSLWNIFKVRESSSLRCSAFRCYNEYFSRSSQQQSLSAPQAGLLLVNSVLILNRRRFLSKYGLDALNHMPPQGDGAVPLRTQLVGLLHAVQYLKVPVIACNVVTIVFEMLLGGT